MNRLVAWLLLPVLLLIDLLILVGLIVGSVLFFSALSLRACLNRSAMFQRSRSLEHAWLLRLLKPVRGRVGRVFGTMRIMFIRFGQNRKG